MLPRARFVSGVEAAPGTRTHKRDNPRAAHAKRSGGRTLAHLGPARIAGRTDNCVLVRPQTGSASRPRMRAISVPPKISSRCNAQCILKTRSSPSAGKGASLQISVSAPTAHQASAYRAICIEARLRLCRAAINLNAAFSPTSRTNHLTCAIALRAFERKLRRRAVNDATAIAARIVACHGSVAAAFWARLISRHNDPLQNSGRGRCGRRKGRRTRRVKHTPGRPRATRSEGAGRWRLISLHRHCQGASPQKT